MIRLAYLPLAIILASAQLFGMAAQAQDDIPKYMNGCFHKSSPNKNTEFIIGPATSAASIAGRMHNDINFTLSLMRFNKGECAQLSTAGNNNERVLLFIKQGQAHLEMAEKNEQLDLFDTALVSSAEQQIKLAGDVDETEVYVMTVIDQCEPSSAHKSLTIARFDKQSPVNDRGLAKLLATFGIDTVNKILRALGPDELYLISGRKEGILQPDYAIEGPDKLIFCLAKMPPGGGPALHIHRLGDEIFVVLAGSIRVIFGDEGEYHRDLSPGDVVLFPPSVNRTFKNIGDEEAILLPIVRGTNKEVEEDIVFLPNEIERIKREENIRSLMLSLAKSLIGLQIKERADIDFPHNDLTNE